MQPFGENVHARLNMMQAS